MNARIAVAGDLAGLVSDLRRITVEVRDANRARGAGVVWRRDGLIVTNAHVVSRRRTTVVLHDGRALDGRLVLWDPSHDLAAIRVNADDLPTAVVASADTLRIGEIVVAFGHPLGVSNALTLGIVHALGPRDPRGHRRWIEADLRLAPGNSGGPLVDGHGRVVGLTSLVAGGRAIALPSTTVTKVLDGGIRHATDAGTRDLSRR